MSWRRMFKVKPNTSDYIFTLPLILHDLHQNFTKNDKKKKKRMDIQSVNLKDEFRFSDIYRSMNAMFHTQS